VNQQALERLIVPGTDPAVAQSYATLAKRALTEQYGFEDEICVVDVETTGYDPVRDRLIEIAAAVMRGPEVLDRFSMLVDPLIPIPLEITKLTGIDDDMVCGALCAEQAVAKLIDFIGDRDIVAHNAAFDRGFVEQVAGRGSLRGTWLDSLVFARLGLPRLRSHRLADLATAFAPEAAERAHRAPDDVASLCAVWRIALAGIADLDAGILQRIVGLAPEANWPEREWLARISAGRTGVAYDLKEVRRHQVSADRAEALYDADEVACSCPTAEEIAGHFTADGLAGRMYEGYEQRAEQVQMAVAVVSAFETSTHLAVEAGTGVGKSMAYLVPAALFSTENGVSVGVATKTNALMDQLVFHELPRLNEALGGGLRYVALKGYDHYPCLRKLERFASELNGNSDIDQIVSTAMLLAWTSQSSWGDLDSVNVHWRREVRGSVQATQADCTRKRCRYYPNLCYLHGVRRRASSANIVVTNHALLFRDVVAQGGILPPVRHWIVDEAHSAESEARRQLTVGASHSEISFLLGALHGRRGGLLDTVRKGLMGVDDPELSMLLARMEEETQRCATLAGSLFDFVKDLAVLTGGSDYDSAELWLDAEARSSGPWATVESTGRSLARRLGELMAHGRDLVTRLEALGGDFNDQRADLVGLITRLDDQHAGLVAVVDAEDESLVYSAEFDRRRNVDAEKLVAARLDVGEVLADNLYARAQSIIYTSATIAMGDSFDHFARAVGLSRLPDEGWKSLRLLSSYDFERQMAVYVPTDLPSPRDGQAAYLTGLEALLEGVHVAMGGSVLTLFTNRREMERLYAILEPRLRAEGLDLVMQSRGTSAKRLRDEFIADEHLSLFALKSFWEGFDAKGDTLRCVVVPKLPFGLPNDPLSRERERRESRAAWSRYQLPEAVIEVKQAAGRLIRSSTDVGCLVIADTRVVRMGYGRQFLRSLPVEDIETAPAAEVVSLIADRFGR
jgi:ATP-dependent DNA helicase DinG